MSVTPDDTTGGPSGMSDPLPSDPLPSFTPLSLATMGRMNKEELAAYANNLQLMVVRGGVPVPSVSGSAGGGPSPLSIRDIRPPNPQHFSGTHDLYKIQNWIDDVQTYCTFYNLNMNDGEAVRTAGMWFSGEAAHWWRTVKTTAPRRWDDFIGLIVNHFADKNSEEILRDQLYNLSQRTSVRVYSADFRRLCLLLGDITETQQLYMFQKGLKQHIRKQVAAQRPRNFAQAEEHACFFDLYEKPEQPRPQTAPQATTPKSGFPGRDSRFGRQSDGGNGNGQRTRPSVQSGSPSQRLTNEERQYLRANNGCFRCRQLGHISTQCPTYPNPPATPSTVTTPSTPSTRPATSRQGLRLNNAESQTTSSTPQDSGFQIRH